MKATIGRKIRAVLEKYPEVKRRRAQLNAVGYLFNHSTNVTVRWYQNDKYVTAMVTNLNAAVEMKPLFEYLYEPPVTVVTPDGDKITGPALGADVKLVFKGGKFEVAP